MLLSMNWDLTLQCKSLLQFWNPERDPVEQTGNRVSGKILKTVIVSWWSTMVRLPEGSERERKTMSKEQGGTAECTRTVQCGEQGGISPVRDVSQGGSASCIEFSQWRCVSCNECGTRGKSPCSVRGKSPCVGSSVRGKFPCRV
jgi:hypothetical protein